jgi:ribosomal protein L37AE/L43A
MIVTKTEDCESDQESTIEGVVEAAADWEEAMARENECSTCKDMTAERAWLAGGYECPDCWAQWEVKDMTVPASVNPPAYAATLRDQFAMAVLPALAADDANWVGKRISIYAYQLADDMLRERWRNAP